MLCEFFKNIFMKSLFLFCSILSLGFSLNNDFFSIHITTLDGFDKQMSEFQNKKILIVVLPVTKTADDSSFLRTVDSVSINYSDQLSVIGILSFEDGYNEADSTALRDYYNGIMGNHVIITKGMYTRKTSAQQHELMFWLTHKEENVHFDSDVEGVRQKFFINEQGSLYGVASPMISLSNKLMQTMMQ
jgi:hypothetical protein